MKNVTKGMSVMDKQIWESQERSVVLHRMHGLFQAFVYYALPDRKPTTEASKEAIDHFINQVHLALATFGDDHNRYTLIKKFLDRLPFTPEVRASIHQQIGLFIRVVGKYGAEYINDLETIGKDAADEKIMEIVYPKKFRVSVLINSLANANLHTWM